VKYLKSIVQKIVSFFTSGQAQAALTRACDLVPQALPIVQDLAAMVPNKTIQEIEAAYQKYAVPFAQQLASTPVAQRGYLLLELATQVLAQKCPGVASNILNTAVQLAVTGVKA
jgi:malonyl CoA-acyl carrier protein transacylase